MAQIFIDVLRSADARWQMGYLRYQGAEGFAETKASYVSPSGVFIVDVGTQRDSFRELAGLGTKLREELSCGERKLCVALLRIDANLEYEMFYEWSDPSRWRITKIGGSGLPEGLAGA